MGQEVKQLIKCDFCDSKAIGRYCDQNDIFKTHFCQIHEAEAFFIYLGSIDNAGTDSIK